MKFLIRLFTLSFLFFSCGGGPTNTTNGAIPEGIEEKKQLLKTKKQELNELNQFITNLEEEIRKQDPSEVEEQRQLVTTAKVGRKDFKRYVEIQGLVEADDLVDATAEVAGRIIQLTVKEGDNVRKGQLVAKLDLEQVNKQIAELETSLDLANTVYERQKRLWDQNIGSEMQYLQAKNSKERLEKSLETLKFQLEKSIVYAPISGVVERLILQGGELATPGMPIVQILNTGKLKVVADVPESYLRSVKRGDWVTVKFPALDLEQKARVSLLGRTIDPSNRTFAVEAGINGSQKLIKPNLLAIMLIQDFEEKNAITVPINMVQQELSGKDFVYIKGEGTDGAIAKKIYVETGESYQGEIIIKAGLNGGEELIIDGARSLAENELIAVQNASENG